MVSVLSDCVPNYITKSGTFILKKKFYRIRNTQYSHCSKTYLASVERNNSTVHRNI